MMRRLVYLPATLFLVCFSLFFLSVEVLGLTETNAGLTPTNWTVSVGGAYTDSEAAAVNLLVEYTKNLSDIFLSDPEHSRNGAGWLFRISPGVKIETGGNDSFNGAIVKLSGIFMKFYNTEIGGVITPDSSRLFHAVPVSFGLETDRDFNNVSGLLEVGYAPFYLKGAGSNWKLGLNPKVGVFLQAGYKYQNGRIAQTGGAADESKESPDSNILRLKGDFEGYFRLGSGFSLIPEATGWYDLANSGAYYALAVTLRLQVIGDKYLDFKYQKGSGEPNFNQGEQFSANLTFQF